MNYDDWLSTEPDLGEPPVPAEPDDDECPGCGALSHEPHQETCHLYQPVCACGRPARRVTADGPKCGQCSTPDQYRKAVA